MKICRTKAEYSTCENEGEEIVRLQGTELVKVDELKYLGSSIQSTGEDGMNGGDENDL